MLRTCVRQRLPAVVPTSSLAVQKRGRADVKASYNSPFEQDTTKIPNFGAYKSRNSETGNKVFQYFMVGTMGGLAAVGAKATVQGNENCVAGQCRPLKKPLSELLAQRRGNVG